ncbi:fluoride efflux transporter FluC [Demequina aurantiaca]|uniref:fluoride efflux transporter FluC n=1 Tax=Demequina aurantiaca TaxID=676200 RepID=UPI003D3565F2
MRLPPALQVFIGGTVGGALRIGLDYAFPAGYQGIPWDIVVINVVGSFILGVVAARSEARGKHAYFPLIGPGLLGGFTTFSAVAALHWTSATGTALAAGVLAVNLVLAFAAAAWGWVIGAQGARTTELLDNLANEPDDATEEPSVGPRVDAERDGS